MSIEISTTKVNQPASYATAAAGGVALGLLVTGATALATRGRTTTPLWSRALVNSGACAGVALALNAMAGGRLGNSALGSSWGQRHQLGFAVAHPQLAGDARAAYGEARDMQRSHWGEQVHVDDGIDAVRHAFGAGVLAARLMHDRGMSAEAAQAIVAQVGDAHEADGIDNESGSAEMDRANNAAGARLGTELAAASAGGAVTPDAMFDRVMSAVRDGSLVVLQDGRSRAATAADVPAPAA